jgi:hypothetical protein
MYETSVKISHSLEIPIASISATGQYDLEKGEFLTYIEESTTPGVASISINFMEPISFNSLMYDALEKESEFLPDTFRFDISDDGIVWESIIKEYEYSRSNKKSCKWKFSMITTNHLKMVIKLNKKDNNGLYRIAFANFKLMISGIESITCSSENDRFWVKENIIDGRPDYGWSSKEKTSPSEEFLMVDLGSINRVDEFRILSKNAIETNFPELFYFYYSEDDLIWHQLHEEPQFISEPGTWYKWKFFPTNMRFFKLVAVNNKANSQKKYVCQLVELEIYAAPEYLSLSKKKIINETPPYSSIMRSGLVRLAADGETNQGVAVQGNDRRLKNATTEFKGIVELATDGEEREDVVVQGNDRRLKNATETSYGLVRLGLNGETRAGVVVQCNDERLRKATEDIYGIVELAEDGETRPGVVVQGNDKRLRKATTKDYGLVILGELGSDDPGKVVTGDDPRFKNATTEKEGILRFASNGEDSPYAAVQGNDKRLRKATTESHGIVELAQSGENKEGVVVQGSDKRLRMASTEDAGIMIFATHNANQPLMAIQSDDPRLYDKREAKAHTHEYAEKNHSYDSHSGLIKLTGNTSSELKNISPPSLNHSVIFGKNEAKGGAGVSGVGVDEGMLGYGDDLGVLGISTGNDEESAGITGLSKKGFGGMFVSQRKHALFANGQSLAKREVQGSGKAILARGDSDFYGTIRVSDNRGNDCLAKYFKNSGNDVLQKGDLVVVVDKEMGVSRARSSHSTKIVGVVVDSASIEFGEKIFGNEFVLVAIYGIVKVNVDSQEGGIILPGDLLVSGLTAGYACKADQNKLKPGMLLGKALGECRKDKSAIQIILTLA